MQVKRRRRRRKRKERQSLDCYTGEGAMQGKGPEYHKRRKKERLFEKLRLKWIYTLTMCSA